MASPGNGFSQKLFAGAGGPTSNVIGQNKKCPSLKLLSQFSHPLGTDETGHRKPVVAESLMDYR